jgi:NADPH:quinone reductase-like Zn-dependent oxidoreductase
MDSAFRINPIHTSGRPDGLPLPLWQGTHSSADSGREEDKSKAIVSLLQSGAVKPIVAKTFPLVEAAEALRYLVEGRPFGRVVLTV